jgi:uncharacterized membrane-anchored protein YhcB (DUF1043 family)
MGTWELAIALAVASAAGLALGFGIGRRSSGARAAMLELREQLESLGKQRDLALAEVEARKEELERRRRELAELRDKVGAHFAGASGLMRELALQYRAFYDHLARGASELWPEGAAEIAAGLERQAIADSPEPGEASGGPEAAGDPGGAAGPPAQ